MFVALELPQDARNTLGQWRSDHLGDSSALRPVAADALHVTLCFLGWRPMVEIDQIAGGCGFLAARRAVQLSLGVPRWLPPRRPRLLAVELNDPENALAGVQAALSDALATGGWYEPETRPYLAHVTVARLRKGARVEHAELPPPPPIAVRGSAVTLYRSRLAPTGARYEPLRRIELGAA